MGWKDAPEVAGGGWASAPIVGEESLPQGQPPLSRTEKVLKGMKDPISGGAQMLTNALPANFVAAGNRLNNWLADKTGMVARLPEGGVDQQVRQEEAVYQARRSAAGESGFDGYRTIGNFVSPVNIGIARVMPAAAAAAALPVRMAVGAAGGAASAAFNPVTEGDFAEEKRKQMLLGGAFGGATPAVMGAVGRVISPNASTNPQLALLKSEGVRPTVGQSLGGWANRAEERLQSVPFLGDSITAARQRSGADLSRAAANRALFPLGQRVPEGVTGNDAVLFVRKAMNDAYDDIAPNLAVQQDKAFQQGVNSLKTGVKQGAINPNAQKSFTNFVKNELDPLFQGQNSMQGETFKRLQSKITEKIQQTSASTDADQRVLNGAYKELGDQLNELLIRSNPQAADKLKAINTGYANFKRLQKAASSVAADDGNFTPAMLHNAVKAADRSKDKARFAEGNALMQDLSSAGKSMLSNKVPNSGTAERLATLGALGGAAYMSPLGALATGGGLLGGMAMYSSPAQALLRGTVSSRPEFAQPVANALQKASPGLIPFGAQVGLGLLN